MMNCDCEPGNAESQTLGRRRPYCGRSPEWAGEMMSGDDHMSSSEHPETFYRQCA